MPLNKSNIKLITILLIFSIIILVMPILVINIGFMKQIAYMLLKTRTNVYEYLQFSGIFLGTIGALGGAVLLTDKKGKL